MVFEKVKKNTSAKLKRREARMAFGTRRRTCAVSSSASHRSVAERALAHANPRLPSVSSAAQIEVLKEKAALTDN